jgi:hypothetical protein
MTLVEETGIRMRPRGRMVTEVDAIVEAHQEGVRISGTLMSIFFIWSYKNIVRYNFPMSAHLYLNQQI